MFEGRNIHFSPVDNKPLCSYSVKICKQRRLNGYAFCLRHILEDPSAPFRQCEYIAKHQQQCSNPVPRNKRHEYCSIHMQNSTSAGVKIGKAKNNICHMAPMLDSRVPIDPCLKRKIKAVGSVAHKHLDMSVQYDPYAFPDVDPEPVKTGRNPCRSSQNKPVDTTAASAPELAQTNVNNSVMDTTNHKSAQEVTSSGPTPIAKLYPELAEKLERPRLAKPEPRTKTSAKNSRTMNRLQTRIAQNKIKDKLKKNQGVVTTPVSELLSPTSVNSQPTKMLPGLEFMNFTNIMDTKTTFSSLTTRVSCPDMDIFKRGMASEKRDNNNFNCPPQLTASSIPHCALYPLVPPEIMAQPPTQPGPGPVLNSFLSLPSPTLVPQATNKSSDIEQSSPAQTTSLEQTSTLSQSAPMKSDFMDNSQVLRPASLPSKPRPISPIKKDSPDVTLPPPTSKPSLQLPAKLSGDIQPSGDVIKPRKKSGLISQKDVSKQLKDSAATALYRRHLKRKTYNMDLLPLGIDSSGSDSEDDDWLPRQRYWMISSSEEDEDEDVDEDLKSNIRLTKLGLLKAKLRRQFQQFRKTGRENACLLENQESDLRTFTTAIRRNPTCASKAITMIDKSYERPTHRHKCLCSEKHPCLFRNDADKQCDGVALPFANHCLRHITYNVDQQMFDYCTAKFSDNTQCCVPVFDIRHELPLCPEHAAKAANYQKTLEARPKKPRKKTKPSALTRPPKKGKKRKNQKRYIRPQKPTPPDNPSSRSEDPMSFTDSTELSSCNATSASLNSDSTLTKELDTGLQNALSPGCIDKNLELPLDSDQATKILDDPEINEVFTKLPEEDFDLFTGKNGEFLPTKEEAEVLESVLAEAGQGVTCNTGDSKYALLRLQQKLGEEECNDDELTKQIADSLLNQNLSPTGSISDDLNQDNLNALASSLSVSDLKQISQVLTPAVLNSTLGVDMAEALNVPSMSQLAQSNISSSNSRQVDQQNNMAGFLNSFHATSANHTHVSKSLPLQSSHIHLTTLPAHFSVNPTVTLQNRTPDSSTQSSSIDSNTLSLGNLATTAVNLSPLLQVNNALQLQAGLGSALPGQSLQGHLCAQNLSGLLGVAQAAPHPSQPSSRTCTADFQSGLPPIQSAFQTHSLPQGALGLKLAYPVQTLIPGGTIPGAFVTPANSTDLTNPAIPVESLMALGLAVSQPQQTQSSNS